MLKARGVSRVARDGDVHVLMPHDGNALANVVGAIATDRSTRAIGVWNGLSHVELTRIVVKLRLYIGKSVDARNDLGSVFAKSVQDDA